MKLEFWLQLILNLSLNIKKHFTTLQVLNYVLLWNLQIKEIYKEKLMNIRKRKAHFKKIWFGNTQLKCCKE